MKNDPRKVIRPNLSSNSCGVNMCGDRWDGDKETEIKINNRADRGFNILLLCLLSIPIWFVSSCYYRNHTVYEQGKIAGELGLHLEDNPYPKYFPNPDCNWDFQRWENGYKWGSYNQKLDNALFKEIK